MLTAVLWAALCCAVLCVQTFNNLFYDLASTQRAYRIWDVDLRSQLRYENVQTILKPYRTFWNTYALALAGCTAQLNSAAQPNGSTA
jgi:hypothetical protein